jgi:hypothetical protein
MKDDKMGWTLSTHGRDEKYVQNFSLKSLRLGNLSVEGMIILKRTRNI